LRCDRPFRIETPGAWSQSGRIASEIAPQVRQIRMVLW
jgi:hypothetical protein